MYIRQHSSALHVWQLLSYVELTGLVLIASKRCALVKLRPWPCADHWLLRPLAVLCASWLAVYDTDSRFAVL